MEKLIINGKDALETWGVSLADGALLDLLKPPPMKAVLENKSAVSPGKQILVTDDAPAVVDERDLNLPVNMFAASQADLTSKFLDFRTELMKGMLNIELTINKGDINERTFKGVFIYKQCSQLQSFLRQKAKFMLQLNQPDPEDFFVISRDWVSNFVTADMKVIFTADKLVFTVKPG